MNPQCGCTTILLNTSARSKDKALDALLQYCKGAEAEDALTKNIEEAVERIKNNEEMMENYMRFEDYVQHEREESIQERNKEICISMLKDGISLAVIHKYTGLSEKEILAIKTNFTNID